MQRSPVFAIGEDDIDNVLSRMIRANVKEIPVLDEVQRVVADITIVDLLRLLFSANKR